MTRTSAPASANFFTASFADSRVFIAAPTLNCPFESYELRGKSRAFFRSVRDIKDTNSFLLLTIGNFPAKN